VLPEAPSPALPEASSRPLALPEVAMLAPAPPGVPVLPEPP
jgi:hypothetical protein